MIKRVEFNSEDYRDSGIVYKSGLEAVHLALQAGKAELAGELAIAILEKTLSVENEDNTDNFEVKMALTGLSSVLERAQTKYEKKKEAKTGNKIEKYKYKDLARLMILGLKQADIALQLGWMKPDGTPDAAKVSYHWKQIQSKPEYRGLLENLQLEQDRSVWTPEFKF